MQEPRLPTGQRRSGDRQGHGGAEALASLNVAPVHLVLSDLHMPNMDGLGLLGEVRKTPKLQKLAFIMLTSAGELDQVKKAVELGVNNYLVKPFTLGTLKRKVEAVIGVLQ